MRQKNFDTSKIQTQEIASLITKFLQETDFNEASIFYRNGKFSIDAFDSLYDYVNCSENRSSVDCIGMCHKFSKLAKAQGGVMPSWLLSSDTEFDTKHKHLIPFRSVGLTALLDEKEYFLGVHLGHTKPILLANGINVEFRGKNYEIETFNPQEFKLHTIYGSMRRHRHFRKEKPNDVQDFSRVMSLLKGTYSIISYGEIARTYIGYNLIEDRVYYQINNSRLHSKKSKSFIEFFQKNDGYFDELLEPDFALMSIIFLQQEREFLLKNFSKQLD